MPISINTKDLYKILERTPPTHNIMLCGKHGIGKSQILTDFYSAKGLPVVTLFLGQMSDPGDLIGLPNIDSSSQKTQFLPPQWFPLDDKPIVLFLDELNRARPEILQAVMDLSLNRKLAGRNLPEGSYVISAVNQGEDYQVTDLDPALVSRFNIYEFKPSVSEWLDWGENHGIDSRILKFIKENSKYLDEIENNSEENLEKTPDRRGWARVSEIIWGVDPIDNVTKKIIAGIVGKGTAAKFIDSITSPPLVSAQDLLLHFDEVKNKLKILFVTTFSTLNEEIFLFLQNNQTNISNFQQLDYAKENPAYPYIRQANQFTPDFQVVADNLYKYSSFLINENKREAFAHFVSIFTDSNFPEANKFITQNCNQVFQQIMNFANSI